MKYFLMFSFVLTAFLSVAAISCSSPIQSDLNWGMLNTAEAISLLTIEPNHSIFVCDKNPSPQPDAVNLIVSSVTAWAKTIGRDTALKIGAGCTASGPGDGLIEVALTENSVCGPRTVGCTNNTANPSYKTSHLVAIRPDFASVTSTYLHEVGHAWG